MAYSGVPLVDWSPLGDLGKVWRDAETRRAMKDVGRGLSDGSLDFRQAASMIASTGDLPNAMSLLKLGEDKANQAAFSADMRELLRYGGDQQTLPVQPPSVPGQAASPQSFAPSAHPGLRPAANAPATALNQPDIPAPPRAEVMPSTKVWGDQEAERAGLYEPRVRVAQAGPNVPMPQAPAAPAPTPTPAPQANPLLNNVPALMQIMAHPGARPEQRKVAEIALTEALKTPENLREYSYYVRQSKAAGQQPMSFMDYTVALKKAGASSVTVDQKSETEFEKKFGGEQAKRWNEYIERGQSAERALLDISTMREISQRVGQTGVGAPIKEALGPFADALGIKIEGLSDIQAYTSIVQRLAPQQRAPGSGSTSDIEFKGFLKSLPTLLQNPAARELTLNTMEALARDEVVRGQIAQRLASGEIKRHDAEKELRALPDPMKGFAEWRKANPQLFGQALKAGSQGGAPATAPSGSGAPSEATPDAPKPPAGAPAHARRAPDGLWYIPDPDRPGKYLQVK